MDGTKCYGTDCPIKESCYRFTASASEYRQSYFFLPPGKLIDDNFECDHYWETKEETDGKSNI